MQTEIVIPWVTWEIIRTKFARKHNRNIILDEDFGIRDIVMFKNNNERDCVKIEFCEPENLTLFLLSNEIDALQNK